LYVGLRLKKKLYIGFTISKQGLANSKEVEHEIEAIEFHVRCKPFTSIN